MCWDDAADEQHVSWQAPSVSVADPFLQFCLPQPDKIKVPVQAHIGSEDGFFPPDVRTLFLSKPCARETWTLSQACTRCDMRLCICMVFLVHYQRLACSAGG